MMDLDLGYALMLWLGLLVGGKFGLVKLLVVVNKNELLVGG